MLMPFLPWLKQYTFELLKADAFAGVTVAIILTPQAMAYAILAGLPPIAGFYAALAGGVFASLWGSSPRLATGPVSIISFLVFSALVPLATPGTPEYIALAAALAVMSGAILLVLGLFRFGFIMRVIPHSVILGFATAAGIIIAVTQIPLLLGFTAERFEYMLPNALSIALNIAHMHGATVLLGVGSLVTLLIAKRFAPRLPAALVVLVLATAASYALDFRELGIAVVGSVPADLPSFRIPDLQLDGWLSLLNKAWIIALVGFLESYAIARMMAATAHQRVDVDQELVGQGIANIAAGFMRGYPVSGSFSRTAVSVNAGAQTGMASVISAAILIASMFLIAPVFGYIPLAVLAAIVTSSVLDLIDLKKLISTYRASRMDGMVAMLTFVVALILKPEDAVAIGVVVALALFIRRIVWAKIRVLGIDREWNILQGVRTTDTVETFPGVLILRIETSAFYGNIDYIIRIIDGLITEEESQGNEIHAIVLDCSSVAYLDLSGAETLREYFEALTEEGIDVCGIYVQRSVVERLERIDALQFFTVLHNIKEMREVLAFPESTTVEEDVV